MENIQVPAILCSKRDQEWHFTLPDFSQKFAEEISIDYSPLTKDQKLFYFDKSSSIFSLDEQVKEKVMDGELCPRVNFVLLPFTLKSKSLQS